jgi:LmbE family N-acetylglucosaminyl deacetylase
MRYSPSSNGEGNVVLIISPHTDDAELGAGGFISKLIEEGYNIYWAVFSIAEESVPEGMPKDVLKKEFINVIKNAGLEESHVFIENIPVRRFDEKRQEILEKMVAWRNCINPDLIITTSTFDQHQDHQVIANESIRAFKGSASIIGYELPWNMSHARTDLLFKLESRHIDKKWRMLREYKSQSEGKKRPYFEEEFIYSLARVRGVQCNHRYAEAFEMIRWVM